MEMNILGSTLDFIFSKWPYLALAIVAIVVIVYITIKTYKYHLSIKEAQKLSEESKNKIASLKCQTHDDNYKSVKESLETLKDMSSSIVTWIMKFDNDMIGTFAKKQSPIVLTNTGEELLEMSSGKKAIDNNLDLLIKELDALNLKTPFDVEEKSLDILLKCTGGDIIEEEKRQKDNLPTS